MNMMKIFFLILIGLLASCSNRADAPSLIPERILQYEASIQTHESGLTTWHTRVVMQFNAPKGGVYQERYAVEVATELVKYKLLKFTAYAFEASQPEAKQELTVNQKKILTQARDGTKSSMLLPEIKIPASAKDQWVVMEYDTEWDVPHIPNLTLILPNVTIDNALFKIKGDSQKLKMDFVGWDLLESKDNTYIFSTKNKKKYQSDYENHHHHYIITSYFSSWEDAAYFPKQGFINPMNEAVDFNQIKSEMQQYLHQNQEALRDSTPTERVVAAAHHWIAHHIEYQASEYDMKYAVRPRPLKEIVASKIGDCKDMTALFMRIMKEFNIVAEPVLIVAGDKPSFSKIPSLMFDHVISYVPEINTYVDLTLRAEFSLHAATSAYENSFVLNLFSGTYQPISSAIKPQIKLTTTISASNKKWIVSKHWQGIGRGAANLISLFGLINEKSRQKPIFSQEGMFFDKKVWSLKKNFLGSKADIFARYEMPIVDKTPIFVADTQKPFPNVLQVLMGFNNEFDYFNIEKETACMSKIPLEEEVIVINIAKPDLTSLKDIEELRSEDSQFTQKITWENNQLRINRVLSYHQKYLYCRSREDGDFQNFHAGIRQSIQKINWLEFKPI